MNPAQINPRAFPMNGASANASCAYTTFDYTVIVHRCPNITFMSYRARSVTPCTMGVTDRVHDDVTARDQLSRPT